MHSLIKQSESVNVQKTHFSIVFVYDLLYILINIKLYQAFVKQLQIITNKNTHISSSPDKKVFWEYVLFFIRDQKSEGATRTPRNVKNS